MVELETSEHQKRELLQEKEGCLQQSEQRLRETTAQLEGALEDAMGQIGDLTMRVSLAEGKTQSLADQLGLADAVRRDLELKLAGLYSALCRTVGIGRSGLSRTAGSRKRSPSPWRNHLQVRGMVMHFKTVQGITMSFTVSSLL